MIVWTFQKQNGHPQLKGILFFHNMFGYLHKIYLIYVLLNYKQFSIGNFSNIDFMWLYWQTTNYVLWHFDGYGWFFSAGTLLYIAPPYTCFSPISPHWWTRGGDCPSYMSYTFHERWNVLNSTEPYVINGTVNWTAVFTNYPKLNDSTLVHLAETYDVLYFNDVHLQALHYGIIASSGWREVRRDYIWLIHLTQNQTAFKVLYTDIKLANNKTDVGMCICWPQVSFVPSWFNSSGMACSILTEASIESRQITSGIKNMKQRGTFKYFIGEVIISVLIGIMGLFGKIFLAYVKCIFYVKLSI